MAKNRYVRELLAAAEREWVDGKEFPDCVRGGPRARDIAKANILSRR